MLDHVLPGNPNSFGEPVVTDSLAADIKSQIEDEHARRRELFDGKDLGCTAQLRSLPVYGWLSWRNILAETTSRKIIRDLLWLPGAPLPTRAGTTCQSARPSYSARQFGCLIGSEWSPEDVLAGNIVPFRGPSWCEMPDREGAIEFGKRVWKAALASARPELVVTSGDRARKAISQVLGIDATKRSARVGTGNGVRLVALPYLGQYLVVGRAESEAGLQSAFGPFWHG